MILQALYRFAQDESLVESMEVKDRLIHLILTIEPDGTPSSVAPWQPLTREVTDPKGKSKFELGRAVPMPEFPGVNSGGKAYFLFDACDKVLGLNGKTGEPIPDDGKNQVKAFNHFWQRIREAHETTKLPELDALLKFFDRYLADTEIRKSLDIVGTVPFGKDGKPTFCAIRSSGDPVPLEKATITFQVGATGSMLFEKGSAIHDYWKATFSRERFGDAPVEGDGKPAVRRGVCLVTGQSDQPIAEVHRTLIKGVPGLPPIGGYVVSFDTSTPSLSSYGFDRGWNAPVSEDAAAAYALGLNHLLAKDSTRRKFGETVLASWVHGTPELNGEVSRICMAPADEDVKAFFDAFETGKYSNGLDDWHFHSLTLAANGGRVVVRRWLDEPLRHAIAALRRWFDDLAIEVIEPPKKGEKSSKVKGGKRPKAGGEPAASQDVVEGSRDRLHPLSILALAATTARIPSEIQDTVYELLHRAALEGARPFCPAMLLPPILQRLRIVAVESGNGIRFHTSRFAIIKLIVNRSEDRPMTIERTLCETNDRPYNCGRLLALLDDIQYAAQGKLGADIVARFYGNASTFPRNVFQRLLRLEKHHRAKLLKDPKPQRRTAGHALARQINDVIALFPPLQPGGPPDFPGQLSAQEQGRFALGFHQQKAAADRAYREALDRKKAGLALTEAEIAAESIVEAAESAPDSESE